MHCTHVGCVHDDAGRHCTDYRPTQLKSYHDSADFAILLLLIVVIQKRSWGLLVGAPPLHSTQRSLIKRRSTEKARLVGVEHILQFCHQLSNCHYCQFVFPTSQSMEAFQPVYDCHNMEGIIYFFLASPTHRKTVVFLSDKGLGYLFKWLFGSSSWSQNIQINQGRCQRLQISFS